jgi:hypothetical protein
MFFHQQAKKKTKKMMDGTALNSGGSMISKW